MNEKLEVKSDERRNFIEIFKCSDMGQVNYSTTKPGVIRGNHFHTRKRELFCVIEGEALIRLRDRGTNEIREYRVSGSEPEIVEMTVGWTHNIQNIGITEMKLLIWASEIFNPDNPDTFREEI